MPTEILTVSNSQLDVWDRCEFRWFLNYGLQLVPNRTQTFFQVGTNSHKLLEIHYKAKRDGIKDTWPLVVEYALTIKYDSNDLGQLTAFKRSLRTVERYIREYAPVHDKGIRILDVERHFLVEMITPKKRPFRLQGYFDMLIEWDGKLWIVDHKTTGTGRFWTEKQLMKDAQMTTYMLGLRNQGYNVFGCAVNQLNTYDYANPEKEPVEKMFCRERTYRTDKQIRSMATNIGKMVDEIYDTSGDLDDLRKSNRRDCEKCPYFRPCLYHDKGMDMNAELSISFKKRDPRPVEIEESEDVESWA